MVFPIPLVPPALAGVLEELRIDLGVLEGVLGELAEGQETTGTQSEPPTISGASFGTLPRGPELARHTELARQAVVDTIRTIRKDLGHYDESVRVFRQGANAADEHSVENMALIQRDLDAVESARQDEGS